MFDFDSWFAKIWAFYPKDLCDNTKGPKEIAKDAARRKVKTQKEADRIMLAMEARIRYDRHAKMNKQFVARWPHVRKYFTQKYYDMEIPSYTQSEQPKVNLVKVKMCRFCNTPIPDEDEVCDYHKALVAEKKKASKPLHDTRMNSLRNAIKPKTVWGE